MTRFNTITAITLLAGLLPGTVLAQTIALSIGVRETGNQVPIGANGGTEGGIEWIDRDLNSITLDGAWQQVTFDLNAPNSVIPFANTSANGVLEGEWGTIEHVRLLNVDGIDQPTRLWFDDLTSQHRAETPVLLGWEGHNLGDEVIFQEPRFSGSTSSNLMVSSSSAVTDAAAYTGDQSLQLDLQFVDGDPARWARVTTFGDHEGAQPTISFSGPVTMMVRGLVVPEPASMALLVLGGVCMLKRRGR